VRMIDRLRRKTLPDHIQRRPARRLTSWATARPGRRLDDPRKKAPPGVAQGHRAGNQPALQAAGQKARRHLVRSSEHGPLYNVGGSPTSEKKETTQSKEPRLQESSRSHFS